MPKTRWCRWTPPSLTTLPGHHGTFGLVAGCFLKGRILHGTVGIFVFPIALYGTCRLAKPGSAWARRRYGARNPGKQERAERRFPPDRRTERFKRVFRDAVGGSPEDEYQAKIGSR